VGESKWQFEVKPEIRVRLDWTGPFILDHDAHLQEHPVEPCPVPDDGPGLYAIASELSERGTHQLSYIGESGSVHSRLTAHYHDWLHDQWRLEVYIAPLDADDSLRRDVEALLIRAHVPPNNTKHIARSTPIERNLRVWNCGRHPFLRPEVSLQHPWFRDEPAV
jgi:hypothetical protein